MPGSAPAGRTLLRLPVLLAALFLPVLLAAGVHAKEGSDPLDEARSHVELGTTYVEVGTDTDNAAKVREGVAHYRKARQLFQQELARSDLSPAQRNRIQAYLVDVESRIEWYDPSDAEAAASGRDVGDVRPPELKPGEPLGAWSRRVRTLYEQTDDPLGRASLARAMAAEAGVLALPSLYALFLSEEMPQARVGVHEALAQVGTSRVARKMGSFARKSAEAHWEHALDVIYRCLEKPETREAEEPFQRAIRAFHKLKQRKLTLRILERLDAMVPEGTAALGEVIYVDDFGYHDTVIEMLSQKQDPRAVPPLVYKMNRFQFDADVQLPAHKALLKMGWYAVPELIDRLDDKAAGIWISWTLRKISGETMGTDKRKWHDWWKGEKVRHPELFADPEERPGRRAPAPVTGEHGK
jgi:hypothetical protein